VGEVKAVRTGINSAEVEVQFSSRSGVLSTVLVSVFLDGVACTEGDTVRVLGELTPSGVSVTVGASEFKVIGRVQHEVAGPVQRPTTAAALPANGEGLPTSTEAAPAALPARPFPIAAPRPAARTPFTASRSIRPVETPAPTLPPPPGGLTVAAKTPLPAPTRAAFGTRLAFSRQPGLVRVEKTPIVQAIALQPPQHSTMPSGVAAPRNALGLRRQGSLHAHEDGVEPQHQALDSEDGHQDDDVASNSAINNPALGRSAGAGVRTAAQAPRPGNAPPTKPDAIDLAIPF
jgi:hypothetical protein